MHGALWLVEQRSQKSGILFKPLLAEAKAAQIITCQLLVAQRGVAVSPDTIREISLPAAAAAIFGARMSAITP